MDKSLAVSFLHNQSACNMFKCSVWHSDIDWFWEFWTFWRSFHRNLVYTKSGFSQVWLNFIEGFCWFFTISFFCSQCLQIATNCTYKLDQPPPKKMVVILLDVSYTMFGKVCTWNYVLLPYSENNWNKNGINVVLLRN